MKLVDYDCSQMRSPHLARAISVLGAPNKALRSLARRDRAIILEKRIIQFPVPINDISYYSHTLG
ncbi:uncharacterized protein CANTADRAFT_27609 [Suhomyces tanzawaensis NRRL Y-17324]|uniref:Uncharacterized protein n=1 Tax=Suhomyces tanzawaensis NRRL Y-17324 TaxID=984487 RepID=A0A1E4SBJ5_9ASCO|nr:uncharacterized protein CANTADRAFT_27609 [Suhomyces tanzawaensis NRRL Y-17324]ODV76855.1 hypothetical protein CANTADRAFT_27609 [Suhomyces tanzawaensis NRRL Y-17324]